MFTILKIKDFQRIEKADLKLAPFTVVVGDNFAGKSTILQALVALLTNRTGSEFIRHGQKTCQVELETIEGDHVVWYKTRNTAEYELNGQRYTKMAGTVPEEILKILKVKPIEIDSTTNIWPQIHSQGEYTFLIPPHLSPGQVARFMGKLTRIDIVVKAQQFCKAAIRQLTTDVKEAQNNIEQTEDELKEFSTLEQEESTLLNITNKFTILKTKVIKYIKALKSFLITQDTKQIINKQNISKEKIEETFENIVLIELVNNLLNEINNTVIPEESPNIDDLKNKVKRLETAFQIYHECNNCNFDLSGTKKQLDLLGDEHDLTSKKLESYQGKECPVCGKIL